MSLLSVCQTVAEEIGFTAPASIVGSSSKTAKQLYRVVNRSGKTLARFPWTILQKENAFVTAADTASYALPSDFGWLIQETAWDRDNYWSMRGPRTPLEWQIFKSGLVASASSRIRFRIKADGASAKFFIDPTPSEANIDLVFEYVSKNWAANSAGSTTYSAYQADTDVALIDEELITLDAIWRFRSSKGLSYMEDKDTAVREIDKAKARDGGIPVVNLSGPRMVPDFRMNLPESGFGS